MASKKKEPVAERVPLYITRQSETVCACGVERKEEDPEFADLPMPEPWGTLRICRFCGALYCEKKRPHPPTDPAPPLGAEIPTEPTGAADAD